jgi:carboxyl-terminal processing protease
MNYAKGQRSIFAVTLILLQVLLLGGTAVTAYQLGVHKAGGSVTVEQGVDLKNFWQAWSIINKNFYGDASVDKRVDGAISGMVSGLGDPYTAYLPPATNSLFKSSLQGSFGGIGAELEQKEGYLVIVAPLQDTPAERAGLLSGDIITKVDGKDISTMSFDEAIATIRGAVGSTVTLTIVRKDEKSAKDIAVTRDTIVIKSVTSDSIGENGSVGYIKVNQFGDDTSKLLKDALAKAVSDNKKGVVIDLRNNPGGFLTSAIEAIGMVLPQTITSDDATLKQRVAVIEKYKDNHEDVERATNAPVAADIPLVVLVNGGSASASEIFSGAMKDYGRAKLVGEKTFGKGSVQNLEDLSNGGSIKVTIAHWLTPKGSEIHGKGIEPDVTIALPKDQKPTKDDIQVQEALKVLSNNGQ